MSEQTIVAIISGIVGISVAIISKTDFFTEIVIDYKKISSFIIHYQINQSPDRIY